jgi:hypothetical protein
MGPPTKLQPQGLELRVHISIQGVELGLKVKGQGLQIQDSGFRAKGFGFRVSGRGSGMRD